MRLWPATTEHSGKDGMRERTTSSASAFQIGGNGRPDVVFIWQCVGIFFSALSQCLTATLLNFTLKQLLYRASSRRCIQMVLQHAVDEALYDPLRRKGIVLQNNVVTLDDGIGLQEQFPRLGHHGSRCQWSIR